MAGKTDNNIEANMNVFKNQKIEYKNVHAMCISKVGISKCIFFKINYFSL